MTSDGEDSNKSSSSSNSSSNEEEEISISESEGGSGSESEGEEKKSRGSSKKKEKKKTKKKTKKSLKKKSKKRDVSESEDDEPQKIKKKKNPSNDMETSCLDTTGLEDIDADVLREHNHNIDGSLTTKTTAKAMTHTTAAAAAASTGTTKQINDIDFQSSSHTSGWTDFESAPSSKTLFFQLKAGGDEFSITIQKKDLSKLFDRVARQMGLPKPKELKLLYPIKLGGCGEKIITLKFNKLPAIFKESLEQFYVQAVPHSTVKVAIESVQRKRKDRPQELTFDRFFDDYHRADKRFYQEMITPSIAHAFLQKSTFIQVLLGTPSCVNLISPGYYLCHVQGCGTLVKLKNFNDLTKIQAHIKDHVHAQHHKNKKTKFSDDKSCVVLLRRFKKLSVQKHIVFSRPAEKSIDELEVRSTKETKDRPAQPYAIKELMKNKVLVKTGENFKGCIYHTPLDIMEKIANHDPTALDGVAESSTVGRMFGTR